MKKVQNKRPRKRGPEPSVLNIDGLDWKDAVKKALRKQRPEGGWPDPPNRKTRKKRKTEKG
jgi:hypothetical protein